MNPTPRARLTRLAALLPSSGTHPRASARRGLAVERNIILPARLVAIAIVYYSFKSSPWITFAAYSLDVGLETVASLFWIYFGAVMFGGGVLLVGRRIPGPLVQATVVLLSLLDALYLGGLTLITGGYDSILYWIFVGLVLRNTVMDPLSPVQLVLNAFTAGCYVLAGVSDYVLARSVDAATRMMLDLGTAANPGEVLLVRTLLLLLVAACGYGVQLLLDRQRRAEAEAQEFTQRENQLRATGRLAAEIAHQLKNPLAIINNTTFSLQRALAPREPSVADFTSVIREEIERADGILTRVMDYARLTEGRLERLAVGPSLDRVLGQVFPPGMEEGVTVHCSCPSHLPPLTMQQAHFDEMLSNLLINAREAVSPPGIIQVQARQTSDGMLQIRVADNGPGIPAEQHQRVFEAYYSSKPKGTGLGLAIVKNTAELYGGAVQVESELGKGTTFTLVFPASASNPSR